jgi:pimeloyl-ACP methyl ester carboxylesterase
MTLPTIILGPGLPVLLLHAFPVDGRMWLEQTRALSDEFQVIVPDQRGFGNPRHLAEGLDEISIDQAADDIAQLLTELNIDKAFIGGISRGGYVSLAFARRHPERLLGLMLFDTRATPADEKERQNYEGMTNRLATEGMGFVPELMKPRLFGPTALAQRPKLIQQVEEMILDQDPQSVAAAARGMMTRPDARPALPSLTIPVIAVAGTEDGAYNDTKAIAEAIPNAKFVEIPQAGHLCNLERPELVTATMRAFLTR